MRKETVRGREMYDDVTTEEMISVLKQAPSREKGSNSGGGGGGENGDMN